MIAAIASAALLVAGSLVVGQAALVLAGLTRPSLVAGPVGLAALLVVAGLVAGWGGEGTVIAVALVALVVAAAIVLLRFDGGSVARSRHDPAALAAAVLAGLCAAIPFIAAGHVGILGVGLVNDDMASHLLLADWIDERFRPEPVLIDQGYPLGPHALVAGVDELLAARSIDVFAGLVLAIPALTALVAYSALDRLARAARVAASALVALPYMAAAYLAQEAFKEPIIALLLIAFALLLPAVRRPRNAIPLGLLAAGTVYVYSFPGLAWLLGTAVVWGLFTALRTEGGKGLPPRLGRELGAWRPLALAAGVAIATLLVLTLPDLGRLLDFVDFRALHPGRANEGGLGNLAGQLSPLEALGVWPTSEFRLSAAASSHPAILFYAGALLAGVAFVIALPRWLRRHGPAIPAALATAVVLYLLARALGTVYTSAKALAIAAPLLTLITLGGLLATEAPRIREAVGERRRKLRSMDARTVRSTDAERFRAVLPHRLPVALGLAFALAAALSSFLILRQAPVAPEAHADELAEIRSLVAGEKLLFLGRDNFVLYELRGSKPFTHVRNFYDPYFVEPNFEISDVAAKFDFDSVTATALAEFPYVLTTRAAYASGPPPGYRVIARTPSYLLWERHGSPLGRMPAERGPEPGRVDGCPRRPPGLVSTFAEPPVTADATAWSHSTVENADPATLELDLAPGAWDLSLQYDATRPVTLSSPDVPGFSKTVPGNLDYRGPAPYWPAGEIEVPGPPGDRPVRITASVERPPLAGRLLGADSIAHLGSIAATRPGEPRVGPGGCDDYVDWFERRRAKARDG
ncbi:MAG: hypothetical protein GEU88_13525 [Solirubrobacterales bacterium]|nr:hypothetical protein [Solirubrobacterales bacterium]